jgi:cobalt-zinc-cadmium efflux system outer membrane protein
LETSPEVAAAAAEIERARAELRRAGVEWIPNVDVMVSARHDNVSGDDVTDVAVEFPLPLFNRNQGAVQAAQSDLVRAEAELSRLELGLQDRLATAFRRYSAARRTVERYDAQILPRAKRSLDFVTNGYDRGQVDYLSLLTSQKSYYQLQIQYLDALQELRATSALIEGNMLMGSLERE